MQIAISHTLMAPHRPASTNPISRSLNADRDMGLEEVVRNTIIII